MTNAKENLSKGREILTHLTQGPTLPFVNKDSGEHNTIVLLLQAVNRHYKRTLESMRTDSTWRHSIILVAGVAGDDIWEAIALPPSPRACAICPPVAGAAVGRGTLPGVPGPWAEVTEAGEPTAELPNDTGVLQPEAGCELSAGTEPGFTTGAGEAAADGGVELGVCLPSCPPVMMTQSVPAFETHLSSIPCN